METTLKNKIETFLNSLNIDNLDVIYYVDIEDIDLSNAFESIYDMLDEKNAFDIEIIYYSHAIEYLKEHDNSLFESLNLAAQLCYEVQNLNSEVLASLLASQNARTDFYEKKEEITNFFNSL
jgi:intracellular sulfur oxidation DsrE/DsrF family protein